MPEPAYIPRVICSEDKDNPGRALTIEPERTLMLPDEKQVLTLTTPLPECPDACYFWRIQTGPGSLDLENAKYTNFTAPPKDQLLPPGLFTTIIEVLSLGEPIAHVEITIQSLEELVKQGVMVKLHWCHELDDPGGFPYQTLVSYSGWVPKGTISGFSYQAGWSCEDCIKKSLIALRMPRLGWIPITDPSLKRFLQ